MRCDSSITTAVTVQEDDDIYTRINGPFKICGETWLDEDEITYGFFEDKFNAIAECHRLNKIAVVMQS